MRVRSPLVVLCQAEEEEEEDGAAIPLELHRQRVEQVFP